MGHAATVVDAVVAAERRSPILFQSLVVTEPQRHGGRTGLTVLLSLALHTVLVLAVAVLPLLYYDVLPGQDAVKAFFVQPLEIAPPPPPPPPPPQTARAIVKPAPRIELHGPQAFVAPIEVPAEITPEQGLDLGIEGGMEGGVEGGVPGGVVGAVIGGLPTVVPPPQRIVRIGGRLAPPKIVQRVDPVYPDLAVQSRLSAMVILEALVDERGRVQSVKVLRGHPLLDEAAVEAVRKWRYQPLLLNGEPTAFILSVTVAFSLRSS